VHADALAPEPGGWDDLALWTGSVARGDDGVWRMYYTGLSSEAGSRDQRIGVAESRDLFSWRRAADAPIVAPDARWYKPDAWRDPFVFRDGDGWRMLITARAAGAPRLRDGVLAHARSADMLHWELEPPLTAPAGFGQLEVPQYRVLDGRPLLIFTCSPKEQAVRSGAFSAWWAPPWDVAAARPFTAEPRLFAAQLIQRRDGGWCLLGFRDTERDGVDSFALLDPIPVALGADGLGSVAPT